MSDPVRLCMVGAGSHSSRNIHPYFHHLEGAEVVANCDLVRERAERLAARFGIPRSYTDYREMIRAEEPDGVMVCVSGEVHARAAVEIMELGCHVYTEKPPADTLEAAREVLATKRRTGRIAMTGFKKHFAPAYARAKAIVSSEAFGQPALLVHLRTKGPGDPTYLLRWGCHAWDLMPFFFGPVASVAALTTPGSAHAWTVNMTFRNGAVGNLAVTDRPAAALEELSAFGDGMTVRVRNSIEMEAFRGDEPVAAYRPSFTQGAQGHVEQGFVPELEAFVAAIRTGTDPESSIEQSAHSVAVYDAIVRSAASGRPEDVPEL